MTRFKKTLLDNGATVVTEENPHSNAVACGVWVNTGTRHEKAHEMGISHFLEHMVFKGTRRRSAFQLARALEAVGGELNAFTTREYTCYHTLSLPEHLGLCLDVLADISLNATFPPNELELERGVILQEIAAAQENYEEYLYDTFFERYFAGSPLGFPILGNEATISSISRAQIRDKYLQKYGGRGLVISVAGQLDHQHVVDTLAKTIGRHRGRARPVKTEKARYKPFCDIIEKDSDQVHILVGLPAPSFLDQTRFDGFIFNALLGGGMTSRLYQKIREKRGLVYSIYSSMNTFIDLGLINIYASTSEKNFKQVLTLILSELSRVTRNGITDSELKLFKTQVRGGILLGSDDVESRMNSLGVNEMVFGRYRPVEEIVSEVEATDSRSLANYLKKKVPLHRKGVLVLGPQGTRRHLPWLKELCREYV
ncbi:MAG TPA: pitrilysin family protein [Bdellovibrionales bacterium]|nr:pitrilysin family protein [Bdellovibrionales bacterium]